MHYRRKKNTGYPLYNKKGKGQRGRWREKDRDRDRETERQRQRKREDIGQKWKVSETLESKIIKNEKENDRIKDQDT